MNRIEIIPLGGIGEFGMNCMGIRYGGEMIIVDAGMGFPEETPYGVDISIPNFDFLEEYREDLTALVLTHGHEDHIGALAYILRKFNLPVYGSRFTLALAEKRLDEFDMLDDVLMHRVRAGDVSKIGAFEVEYIHASHSLVDCFSLAIKTPIGTLIHTGDYKIDDTPVIGKPYDLDTLGRYGREGVLALLADSTNATVPGRTPSEQAVIPAFRERNRDLRIHLNYPVVVCSSFEKLFRTDFFNSTEPVQINENFQLEIQYAYTDHSNTVRSDHFLIDFVEYGWQ